MSDPTDSIVVVAKYLQNWIRTAMATGPVAPLRDVYYGDQAKIPFTPVACVETGDKRRSLNGAPRRVDTPMTIYILIYHFTVGNNEVVREEADQLGEDVETLIHTDVRLDGLVIDSLVTSLEYGYARRGDSLFRTSRLTLECRQQVQLPSSI